MRNVSSVVTVRTAWWISRLPPRMTNSTVLTAMTTTLPQDVTAVAISSVLVRLKSDIHVYIRHTYNEKALYKTIYFF